MVLLLDEEKVQSLFNKYNVPTTMNVGYKYPVQAKRYTKIVGDILPEVLKLILEDKGYFVDMNWAFQNGVDMSIFNNNTLILVGEIFNVWKKSYILSRRAEGYIRNLRKYDCNRVIICSLDNKLREFFHDIDDIYLICLGYQLLPQTFYDFFKKKKQVDMRKPLTLETLSHIDLLITKYLEKENLLVVT